jgi:phosphoadenosine phosphosulfate reductase
MIHLAEQVAPGIDVIFLDTGYHFVETFGTRDAVKLVHGVNVINVTPEQTVAEQDATSGKDLFARDPDRCCALRKVAPLGKALEPYAAWATGVRRADSPARANTPLVSWDAARKLIRIAPLAAWSDEDVARYIEINALMINPLLDDGYTSIGCEPCTSKPSSNDPRAGWAGFAKTECGINSDRPTAIADATSRDDQIQDPLTWWAKRGNTLVYRSAVSRKVHHCPRPR